MPHIIVEYSQSLEPQIPALLTALHDKLASLGIDKTRIKTRGLAISHALVGEQGEQGTMLHATLLLLTGRDVETRQSYGEALYTLLKEAAPQNCAATFEIREMDKDTYYL